MISKEGHTGPGTLNSLRRSLSRNMLFTTKLAHGSVKEAVQNCVASGSRPFCFREV